ncbi:hypothetical protein SK128_016361 [Halocaridina rubra]|uniref:Guanylate cyclase domain-containing protein n=1 Tax=Halocaridina rubra TaxID=373956 RepID=A0AAN8XLQ3_HALRR
MAVSPLHLKQFITPMKVHISQTTKEILEIVGGYSFEFRGYQEVKGKGSMPTFWVSGSPSPSHKGLRIPVKNATE